MNTMQILSALWIAIDFWMLGVVALFTLFCYILRRLDKSQDATFKFHDLFTSGDWNGKASIARLGYFNAMLVHALIVLHQEMKTGASTEMMSMYALIWSGAYVVLKYVDMKAAQIQVPTVTVTPAVTATASITTGETNETK